MKVDQGQKDEPSNGARPEEGPRSFTHFLATVSDGEAEGQLSDELYELGRSLKEQVHAQGRKVSGSLTLKVKLIAETNGTVSVFYAVDTKAPKPLTTPALYWLTKDGNLSATDTRQLQLRPREVPGPRRDVRDAPAPQPPREV
ncbi:MAG: hypothetical protein ABUR63_00360 [Verrucomicrobiota bacterium]